MKAPLIAVFVLIILNVSAQDVATGDTSFTTYAAYKKAIKNHPGITIAPELYSSGIKMENNIVYCDINGRKLLLDVFSPAARERSNNISIVIIHGGGWRSGNRIQHYPLAQRLALLGYTCFTIEYRLSTEALYPAAVVDVKSAIQWVRSNAAAYAIDSSKIAVLGFSAGGELAAFAGVTGDLKKYEIGGCNTTVSSRANAVIDIDGTLSFVHSESSEGDDSKKLSAATQWFGVAKKDSIELWKDASPLTYVNGYTPPTLFINSTVSSMHAGREDYIRVLNEHHIYFEVHSFENSPHSFCLFNPWFEPTVKYIDDFLRKVLAG